MHSISPLLWIVAVQLLVIGGAAWLAQNGCGGKLTRLKPDTRWLRLPFKSLMLLPPLLAVLLPFQGLCAPRGSDEMRAGQRIGLARQLGNDRAHRIHGRGLYPGSPRRVRGPVVIGEILVRAPMIPSRGRLVVKPAAVGAPQVVFAGEFA